VDRLSESPTLVVRASADDLARTIALIAAMFLASRVAMLMIASWATTHLPMPDNLVHGWLGPFCRWDCGWYLGIAEHGYSLHEDPTQPGATNFAFFPLYPLLVQLVAPLFGGLLLPTAVAVSNVFFFVALVYVYRYARLVGIDHRAALLSVALLCLLPHSLALSAAMSESTYLLLFVVAAYYLRTGLYLIAGIAAALLSATRAPGVFFALFALVFVLRNDGWRSILQPWRRPERLLPVVLAPLGLFVFWGYCFVATGDAFAHESAMHHGWGWSFVPPLKNLPLLLRIGGAPALMAIGGLVILACTLLLLRLHLYEEALFCLAAVLLVLSSQGATSAFRYWIVLFPAWMALAQWASRRPLATTAVVLLALAFNVFMVTAWTIQSAVSF
jgi:hypothetical protein